MELQELIDRAEITDALTRYTLAVDDGDWDALDTVFAGDATIDYSESGGTVGEVADVKKWLAEMLPAFSSKRLHTIGQVGITFTEEGAEVVAYFDNPMVIADGSGGERVVEVGGRYRHSFVRTPQGWRSRHLHEEVFWTRGF
ncbi:SnoaL-like domain-containing protein [Nocardioides sp. YR527]|uniref:nuclear transport factor 2 family protein n=1 Tax=Nocardioides sp. YR527 TaxID=1881028 RepID=UPI000890B75B|nr:nuclear transport factor 2 family protein [Nocardioides sp. YR527]SDJ81974.1 SnoaL-like domain-containing protein [Nocardioides sp. YR527]